MALATVGVNEGTDRDVLVKRISGQDIQVVAAAFGDGDTNTLVTSASPLPVASAASENVLGKTVSPHIYKTVTLSLDTSIYAAGDLLADTQAVTTAVRVTGGTGTAYSLTVIDEDDQKPAMTVYLLNADVSMGTENSAPSITDANARSITGFFDISAADYRDLGGVSVAQVMKNVPVAAASGTTTAYIAAVLNAGTPTHTASGIVLGLGIYQA